MMSERIPPFSEDAEKGVLGCLLLECERVLDIAVNLFGIKPEAWYVPEHRMLADAIFALAKRDGGLGVDILTFTQYLRDNDLIDKVGGVSAVEKMIDSTPTAAHAEHYLRIMRDKWLLRTTIEGALVIVNEAFGIVENAEAFCQAAPEKLMGIAEVSGAKEPDNGEIMDGLVIRWRDSKAYRLGDMTKKPAYGLNTPWQALTHLMCGLEEGLTILGGRPSAGKTTLEDMLSIGVAEETGEQVVRVTLDSSKKELISRSMCRSAGVSLPKLKYGFARENQLRAIEEAGHELRKLPFTIRTDLRDVSAIRMFALNEKRKRGLAMLTVDYIQQVTAVELGWNSNNTLARTTFVIGAFKALARELKVPVLVLSQLSRRTETDKDGTDPEMSDLRDSGALEQDADKILMVSVKKKKKEEMEKLDKDATVHKRPVSVALVKHKNGEIGSIPFWLLAPYFKFVPAEPDWTDDALPGDKREIDKEFSVVPSTRPQPEQEEEGVSDAQDD